ncbi:UNKNOWN [Stylonychia lemnae]|uniref:Uncharacterized protein n=1 Tax=Stylonychia lemnae TaxID=5949 RepID=A0A078B5J3_STYLE|nr:UNKNOWN [Stylonychia lemnae]|eukprot:CDW88572.1 UNKNOWN [Stylonychia lemnae]
MGFQDQDTTNLPLRKLNFFSLSYRSRSSGSSSCSTNENDYDYGSKGSFKNYDVCNDKYCSEDKYQGYINAIKGVNTATQSQRGMILIIVTIIIIIRILMMILRYLKISSYPQIKINRAMEDTDMGKAQTIKRFTIQIASLSMLITSNNNIIISSKFNSHMDMDSLLMAQTQIANTSDF